MKTLTMLVFMLCACDPTAAPDSATQTAPPTFAVPDAGTPSKDAGVSVPDAGAMARDAGP